MTDYKPLERNLMDIIKEEQAKLGYRKERIRLYYPLSSLNHFFQSNFTVEEMNECLKEFCQNVAPRLGSITITNQGERFCFSIPEQGTEYVHDHSKKDEFIFRLVEVVSRHDCRMEDILSVFHSCSRQVHVEEVHNGEFDYLIYFENGQPDNYRYCFHVEDFHIIYHRYLPEDYKDLGLE